MLAHQYATSNLVKKKKKGKRKAIHPLLIEVTERIPRKKKKRKKHTHKKNQTSSILCNRLNLHWLGKFHFLQGKGKVPVCALLLEASSKV